MGSKTLAVKELGRNTLKAGVVVMIEGTCSEQGGVRANESERWLKSKNKVHRFAKTESKKQVHI